MTFKPLGYFLSPKGLKGEIFVRLYKEEGSILKEGEKIFLLDGEESEVFSVEKFVVLPKGFVLKMKEINDIDSTRLLKGREFFVEAKDHKKPFFLGRRVIGFTIFDISRGIIGEVATFSILPSYVLLSCSSKKGGFDIPLVELLVVDVDPATKTIKVDLPENYPGVDDED